MCNVLCTPVISSLFSTIGYSLHVHNIPLHKVPQTGNFTSQLFFIYSIHNNYAIIMRKLRKTSTKNTFLSCIFLRSIKYVTVMVEDAFHLKLPVVFSYPQYKVSASACDASLMPFSQVFLWSALYDCGPNGKFTPEYLPLPYVLSILNVPRANLYLRVRTWSVDTNDLAIPRWLYFKKLKYSSQWKEILPGHLKKQTKKN